MSEAITPQAAPKPLTIAELETIPNWRALTPADQKILTLMLGPKLLTMELALVQVYPHLSPIQIQGCVQFLLSESEVRAVLKFAGIETSVPGAPPAPAVVIKPASTERIDLADLWARPDFNDLAPVVIPRSSDRYTAPAKLDIQKIISFYFTIARRNMAKAIIMTNPHFTSDEIAEIVTTIQADQNIQAVLALVGESNGN